jgi:cytochrome b561
MIALPLSGWVYVSAGWSPEAGRPLVVPTYYFDLFRVPHLFGLEHAPEATRAGVAGAAVETHEALVWAALALLALHVGAAFKHWLFDRDAVLPQMAPGLPALGGEPAPVIEPARRNALIGAGAAVALAALAIGAFINRPIPAPTTSSLEAAADVEVAEPGESDEAVAPSADAAESADAPTPARWRVDHALSAIEFGGDQGGQPFSGRFGRWSAEIVFDPDNLEASSAVVTIQTSSAADGVPQHDEALPGPEWFDVARFPTATFRTTRIRHRGGDQYEARGLLSVRDQSVRVRLPFTLTIEDGHARMAGQLTLDRRALGLGVRSLADEYVSEAIAVRVAVEADRAS